MQFFMGLVSEDGHRQVLKASAEPTIEGAEALTDGWMLPDELDWGPDSIYSASWKLAMILLGEVVSGQTAFIWADEYAAEVIRVKLETGKRWLLSRKEIEDWLAERQLVQ